MTWRDKIRPLVRSIIDRVGRENVKKCKRALIEERPSWVSQCSWQTKIWRDETNKQLGLKRSKKFYQSTLPPFLKMEEDYEHNNKTNLE